MQKTIFNSFLRNYTYQHLLLYMSSCKGIMIFTKCSKDSKTIFEDFKIEIFCELEFLKGMFWGVITEFEGKKW